MSYSSVVFPHHKLDAYNVSVEFAVAVRALIERMPRGNANLSDQLSRASVSTVTNIAEGANRLGTGEKRQKFSIARGEVGEAAACIELAAALGLVSRTDGRNAPRPLVDCRLRPKPAWWMRVRTRFTAATSTATHFRSCCDGGQGRPRSRVGAARGVEA